MQTSSSSRFNICINNPVLADTTAEEIAVVLEKRHTWMEHQFRLIPEMGGLWYAKYKQVPARWDLLGPAFPTICKTIESYGTGDGEKRFCVPTTQLQPGCVIISVGSANQWGFEVEVSKRTPCHIYTVDCTMTEAPNPPASLKGRMTFLPLCLGITTTGAFRTYEDLLKEIISSPDAPPPVFLKFDIEGYEWGVLASLLHAHEEAQKLGKDILPFQIALEVHTHAHYDDWNAEKVLRSFNDMWTRGGYVIASKMPSKVCGTLCHEILVVRAKC